MGLRKPRRWKWFAFPGVSEQISAPGMTAAKGQLSQMLPGGPPPNQLHRPPAIPKGRSVFIDEHEAATAVVSKIFPNGSVTEEIDVFGYLWNRSRRYVGWLLTLTVVCGAAYLTYTGAKVWYESNFVEPQEVEQESERSKTQETELDTSRATIEDQKAEIENLKEQVKSLKTSPKGLDAPPCWVSAETGAPDFLFHVHIEEEALRVTRAAPGSRDMAYSSLPFDRGALGKPLGLQEFRKAFAPLYEANLNEGCRHFVRLTEGAHDTLGRYKAQRDVVESYFYVYRPDFLKTPVKD